MAKLHLKLEQRVKIQEGLANRWKIRRIARYAGVSRPTVVREIKAYRYDKLEWACRFGGQNWCVKRDKCGVFGVCKGGKGCSAKCWKCKSCNRYCDKFVPERCNEHYHKAPYVCTGCAFINVCARMHTYYDAVRADNMARREWGAARKGANITCSELDGYAKIISEGLKKGQSLYAIHTNNRAKFDCHVRTLYNYVTDKLLPGCKRGDLQRACMIRPRRNKGKEYRVDRECHVGRTFDKFVEYLENNEYAIEHTTEMDCIEGRRGGKVILTFFNVATYMGFGILCDHKDAFTINDAIVTLHGAFGDTFFKIIFGVLLTDRGTEFSNPTEIESLCGINADGSYKGKVFYCDAGNPTQKAGIERNNEETRRVIVKGVSLDNLTQEDVNLVFSHLNSYPRQELGGLTPWEMFRFVYTEDAVEFAKGFGLREIPANEVIRTPALIPDIARQVLEKAKRIAKEEEITRKALERHRKSSGK